MRRPRGGVEVENGVVERGRNDDGVGVDLPARTGNVMSCVVDVIETLHSIETLATRIKDKNNLSDIPLTHKNHIINPF